MRIEVIQQKVQIGSQVTVMLRSGEEVTGQLTEIGIDYIMLRETDRPRILDADEIGGIQIGDIQNQNDPVGQSIPVPSKSISNDVIETSKPKLLINPVFPDERVSKKFVEIENQFNIKVDTTSFNLEEPDITFPEEHKDLLRTTISSDWVSIKNKYQNARKINELDPKYRKIQQIVGEFQQLVDRLPNSPTLNRILAYFYSIADEWDSALHNYQVAAVLSEDVQDWFDVAVCALKLDKQEIACYGFSKYFLEVNVVGDLQGWNLYVNLLEKFNDTTTLCELTKTDNYDFDEEEDEEELEVILNSAIFLLKKKNHTEKAIEIIQKHLNGDSIRSLLEQIRQPLQVEPVETYQQFLTEFTDTLSKLEKEQESRISQPKKPVITYTAKHSKSGKTPPKYTSQKRNKSKVDDLYGKAKYADMNGNLEDAEKLYEECLHQNIRTESAIKDWAAVLIRLGRTDEAVEKLEKYSEDFYNRIENNRSFNNQLISAYQHNDQYEKAVELLINALNQTHGNERKAEIRGQIARAYVKLENYADAEKEFRTVLKLRPGNFTMQRNLALCLSKQGNYDEAITILNEIQRTSPDEKTAELLVTIENAATIGGITNIEMSDLSTEISEFDRFILERCTFEGIRAGRRKDEGYGGSEIDARYDIERLEGYAKDAKTSLGKVRARFCLSAARIYYDLENYCQDLYRYLCRSYASWGYNAVDENIHLDSVRVWFSEALRVYDVVHDRNYDEQDAVNALTRFLYSYMGRERIPTSSPPEHDKERILEQQKEYISNTVSQVISDQNNQEQVFESIGYLLNNRYAEKRIVPCLYNNPDSKTAALAYLQNRGIDIPATIQSNDDLSYDDFINVWHQLRDKNFRERIAISKDFDYIKKNFAFVTSQLENCISRTNSIVEKVFFELDKERVQELTSIISTALKVCNAVSFDERERLYGQINQSCEHILNQIEKSPTKVSVEYIYQVLKVVQEKVRERLDDLYENSKPDLTLRLVTESYPIDQKIIKVSIVVENLDGRMSANSIKLVIQDNEKNFSIEDNDLIEENKITLRESLSGGEQLISEPKLHLTGHALDTKAFSLTVFAEYEIHGDKREKSKEFNLPIRLNKSNNFEDFHNPYRRFANGFEVDVDSMFKGREELIERIKNYIRDAGDRSIGILIYGQFRSGKSSVRLHLKKKLDDDNNFFVADLKDLNLNEDANRPIFSQILVRILNALREEVQNRLNTNNYTPLNHNLPSDEEFDNHSDPQLYFKEIIHRFKQIIHQEWGDEQIILLIDEFQVIYEKMVTTDKLSPDFMRTWKGFLQRNLFSAVLVGQQVMAKFRNDDDFRNVFAGMKHEKVSYLTDIYAEELIVEPILKDGKSRYLEKAVESILELTAGSAYYIQIICHHLVEYMKVERIDWVTEADVQRIAENLISGYTKDDFHMFTDSGDRSLHQIPDEEALTVLMTIADHSRGGTGSCHRSQIHCDTNLEIDDILTDLMARDVVEYEPGGYYKIKVGLFKEWLLRQIG